MGIIGQGQYLWCSEAVSTLREINDGNSRVAHFKLCHTNRIRDIQQRTEKSYAKVVVGKEGNTFFIGLYDLVGTTFFDMLIAQRE